MGAARHVQRHRVEEAFGRHLIAEGGHGRGKDLGHAMGTLGAFPDALRPIKDGEHRGDDGQQHLRGADVARRLFAADMLLAGLHRHAQRRRAA